MGPGRGTNDMRSNVLVGHMLKREGRVFNPTNSYGSNGSGSTACSCGQWSGVLPSTRARQQWHREHKAEVRKTSAVPHDFQGDGSDCKLCGEGIFYYLHREEESNAAREEGDLGNDVGRDPLRDGAVVGRGERESGTPAGGGQESSREGRGVPVV